MVRLALFHPILAIFAHLDLELYQMDIKTIFLSEKLAWEIYMDQPTGFVANGQESKVRKLR